MALNRVVICGVNTARLPLLTDKEKDELFDRIEQGDMAARETFIKGNLRLVLSVIQRFSNSNENPDDLFQVGCIGLIKAIDNFDRSLNVKFSTYAVPMIMGEIKRFLRDGSMMKVSRSLKENGWKIQKASDMLSQKYGRDATLQEISAEVGLSVEDIVEAIEANGEVTSIYQPVYQSDDSELYLVDQVSDSGVQKTEELVDHLLIEQLLGELDETEKELIELRYFQDMTQTQIAGRLGISQVQVSRMERKILLRMRQASEK